MISFFLRKVYEELEKKCLSEFYEKKLCLGEKGAVSSCSPNTAQPYVTGGTAERCSDACTRCTCTLAYFFFLHLLSFSALQKPKFINVQEKVPVSNFPSINMLHDSYPNNHSAARKYGVKSLKSMQHLLFISTQSGFCHSCPNTLTGESN